jgi:hypothetical protein
VPNRILREGILTSPRIAKLGWAEEVFYRRMHSVVDDFGRYFADVGMLRAACYPRQLNKVSDSDVGKWLHACAAAALVRVYQVDGEDYLLLLDFNQQVRAKKSKFPNPPSECAADAQQVPANEHLGVSVFVSVSEGVDDAPPAGKAKSRKTEIPEGFCISERVRAWAVVKKFTRLEEHFESFVSKCKAKGYTYADWDEGFMGAVRDDWAELRTADAKAQGRHTDSAEDTARRLEEARQGTKPPDPATRQRLAELRKAA